VYSLVGAGGVVADEKNEKEFKKCEENVNMVSGN